MTYSNLSDINEDDRRTLFAKPHKSWFFTYHLDPSDVESWRDGTFAKKVNFMDCTYSIIAYESAGGDTPHLQGCITFKRAKRFSGMKKIDDKAHWEPVRDLEAARNYCLKEDDYEINDNRTQGQRNDVTDAVALLKAPDGGLRAVRDQFPEVYLKYHTGLDKMDVINDAPRDFEPTVLWFYGPTGSGKTRDAVQYATDRSLPYWMSGETGQWFPFYRGEDVSIFDDFRGDFCKFHTLLKLTDRYKYSVAVKGGHREFNSRIMIFTSPYPPDRIYQTVEDCKQLLRRLTDVYHYVKTDGVYHTVPWDKDEEGIVVSPDTTPRFVQPICSTFQDFRTA